MFSVALFVPCATRPTVVFGHGTQCNTNQHVMWYNNIIIYEPGTAASRIILKIKKIREKNNNNKYTQYSQVKTEPSAAGPI